MNAKIPSKKGFLKNAGRIGGTVCSLLLFVAVGMSFIAREMPHSEPVTAEKHSHVNEYFQCDGFVETLDHSADEVVLDCPLNWSEYRFVRTLSHDAMHLVAEQNAVHNAILSGDYDAKLSATVSAEEAFDISYREYRRAMQ